MHAALKAAYDAEMAHAQALRAAADLDAAFHHLERAHILAQRYTWRHVSTHFAMLHVGWLRRDAREVIGQFTRSIAAALFSRIWVPAGNTGGANVSAFRPMPIPADLAALFDPDATGRRNAQ